MPIDRINDAAGYRTLTINVGFDETRIDGKAFAFDQAFVHATPDALLKQMTKGITLTKPAVKVLGKAGMIRHRIIQS
jgi:hypothetical protein